ncbi:NAD(P)H-dependent oxidoreductase [Marinobacterium zhoushanense]|uniref:NAD(P)H-dependent oxidoreductase n=1 Tax=Marinobacterium zhoushanense TaxID=1679163 RepID=A0ABQ1JZG5_9GAMM|nr:NAD(P)H-dependent oxidoreductase [Marinobacterium zhoushanense]GGB81695.1 NAD(P)H-dependent oxidoreductase [Marinobacterium zhoushanense]
MNINEALDWRYAVREFSNQKLEDDEVENLIEATRKSASSYGLQPYKLIVIKSTAIRRDLLPHSFGQRKVLDCSHLVVLAAYTDIGDHTVDRYIDQLMKVRGVSYDDIAGYACHMKDALSAKTNREKREWAHQQAYIALGTLLTAAAALKIDSCPMTGFNHAAYDEVLGLTDMGLEVSSIVSLGHRSPEDVNAQLPKVRFDDEDIVIRF